MLTSHHYVTPGTPMRQTYFETAFERLIGRYVRPTKLSRRNDVLIDT